MPRPIVVATAAPMRPSSGKGPRPKNEARVEHDVDAVREPQGTHGGSGIARAAENGVIEKEQKNRRHPPYMTRV